MDKLQKVLKEESDINAYKIGVFEGKDYLDYRTQFYKIFGRGDGRNIKNEKALLKTWFDQIDLQGNRVLLCINRRHQIQLKDNKYLKQLLKEKYIKVVRDGSLPHGKSSYLIKV